MPDFNHSLLSYFSFLQDAPFWLADPKQWDKIRVQMAILEDLKQRWSIICFSAVFLTATAICMAILMA